MKRAAAKSTPRPRKGRPAAGKARKSRKSSSARASNMQFAQKRISAWRTWDDAQDRELHTATAALSGYPAPIAGIRGRGARGNLSASYDAAGASDGNTRHWANSDSLGAVAANSASVRGTLRRRARYEVANNCTARGILMTKAQDVIGRGPRVQFDTGSTEANSILEGAFAKWAKASKLAPKLRTAVTARIQDGEIFALFTTNKSLRHPVKADLRLVECDQIADPYQPVQTPNRVDGIQFDAEGNPVTYRMLKQHPGELYLTPNPMEYSDIPADQIVHWFRADRPGQVRGIPEITPALPLMAQCRRFVLATLDAAEAAADFAVLLYTEMPPYIEDGSSIATPVTPMTSFDIERRMMTAMPAGWKATQMKAEHPATTFAMFKKSIVNDFGRCLCMPYGVAAGDSSEYNFASGRLDLLPYRKSLEIEQGELEADLLDRLLTTWMAEALAYYGILYPIISTIDPARVTWSFVWDAVGYGVNPVDEANARKVDLQSGLTSRPREFERAGLDWEAEDERAAKSFGVSVDEYRKRLFEATYPGQKAKDDGDPESKANDQDQRQQDLQRQKRADEEKSAASKSSKKE